MTSGQPQLRLVAVHTANGALMLDDTYNASPESTMAALNLLEDLGGSKIAVLGDMLELGQYEKRGHELVGCTRRRDRQQPGDPGRAGPHHRRSRPAGRMHPKSLVSSFDTTDQVIAHLKKILQSGDVALIKGSHGMRMDRIVAALEVNQ